MTLHPKWTWNIIAQIFTVVIAFYTVIGVPAYYTIKSLMRSEIHYAIEKAMECKEAEHQAIEDKMQKQDNQIKSSIIRYHPNEYYKLYGVRGGGGTDISFVPFVGIYTIERYEFQ